MLYGYEKETGKLDKKMISLVAEELKSFHDGTQSNEFNLPQVPFPDKAKRKSALHFDLTRENIFLQKDKIFFIDFDDAKYGGSVCDVAILIANLFFSKSRGTDIEEMQTFIEKYYGEDIELKHTEQPLIKEYALNWINYILNGNEFDTSTEKSFKTRYELIDRYL